jgi:uncharacterized SAM-binding protein YcdF (DUF218 family)
MFVLKQFLKQLILPPMPWILALVLVLLCWRRPAARKLLFFTICAILMLHSNLISRWLRYPLESRYAPLLDSRTAEPYDAIVVLTSASIPAGGLAPFPTIDEYMFRRLEEAYRLYKIQPKPIVVSGGHVDPFTPDRHENKIARDYLLRWGVPPDHILAEAKSRDTFESAVEVGNLLKQKRWRRYLLVTSAVHMPRSMFAFSAHAPEPIAAPGDFTIRELTLSPLDFAPSTAAARSIALSIHEYVGLANYYWRVFYQRSIARHANPGWSSGPALLASRTSRTHTLLI